MELVKVCAFALMGVLLALQFKGGKQEYGIYLGAALALWYFPAPFPIWDRQKNS